MTRTLIAAFNEGEDFHAETAARVFDVPVDEVTPALRSRAKAVNFGIVYGQQAYGLSQSLDIPQAEAREMIDRYFEAYPGVRTFLDRTVADAKQTGYAETLFGARPPHPRAQDARALAARLWRAHRHEPPMQGTAADIIKIAMVRVAHRLEDEGFAARMILQVHDELDFECPEDEVERLIAMVRAEMEGVVTLAVPLVADCLGGYHLGRREVTRRTRTGLPTGTFLLVATRFLVYLGVQAAYFIGIIGTLTYEVGASTWALAGAVGFFNLFIIFGNAAGGTLLDVRGPRAACRGDACRGQWQRACSFSSARPAWQTCSP